MASTQTEARTPSAACRPSQRNVRNGLLPGLSAGDISTPRNSALGAGGCAKRGASRAKLWL
eukprot:7759600-Alexandrium_andersonii.AAC.1